MQGYAISFGRSYARNAPPSPPPALTFPVSPRRPSSSLYLIKKMEV